MASNREKLSLEELKVQTAVVKQIPGIVSVVERAGSSQDAENVLKQLEYPTSLVREAKLLWLLKKGHPQDFANITRRCSGKKISPERIFPCSYNLSDCSYTLSDDAYGSMLVRPHPVLPPLFWDFTLLDGTGDTIYSAEGVGEKYERDHDLRDGVESVLLHGSRSLPVALRIGFETDYGRDILITFKVTPKGGDETFVFTRCISGKETAGRRQEWYGRCVHSLQNGLDCDRVSLHRLDPSEVRAISEMTPREGEENWALTLETWINIPANGQHLNCLLTTIYLIPYYYHWQECKADKSFQMQRVEKMRIPCLLPDGPHFMWGPFVQHYGVNDNQRLETRSLRADGLEGEICQILNHTPETVDGLACLWNLFSFKGMSSSIYNYSSTEEILANEFSYRGAPLPPWKSKQKDKHIDF